MKIYGVKDSYIEIKQRFWGIASGCFADDFAEVSKIVDAGAISDL